MLEDRPQDQPSLSDRDAAEAVPDAVDVRRPGGASSPLVFCVPHAGPYLPQSFVDAARFDLKGLRTTEDAFVDELIGFEALDGVWALRANYGRAFVDVNRHPMELDPRLIRGTLPKGALSQTLRVKSGYGVIPRCLTAQTEIYRQPIDYSEARDRLETVHAPYHAALSQLLAEVRATHGRAVLIDWHSMPSSALKLRGEKRLPDMVLGDLFGEACAPQLTAFVKSRLETEGYKVALNHPFAGGYTLENYAKPSGGVEALQIEINRAIYMDEAGLSLKPQATALKAALGRVIAALKARFI